MVDYRRPGVYIAEQLSTAPFESANATAVACFVGVSAKGQPFSAVRCDSWSDFVQKFGGFDQVPYSNPSGTSAGRSVNGTTVSGNPSVVVTSGTMTSADVGRTVTGTGVPAAATITAVADGTHFTLSANATGAGTGTALTLGSKSIPGSSGKVISYLPYAVYSYFQNGGRGMFVVRTMPSDETKQGATATVNVTDGATTPKAVMSFTATGAGAWGSDITVDVSQQAQSENGDLIFAMTVMSKGSRVETFGNLSMGGVEGTRPVAVAVNDPLAGSRYIVVAVDDPTIDPKVGTVALVGGVDPALPGSTDLIAGDVTEAILSIEGPLIVTFQPYQDGAGTVIMPPAQAVTGLTTERSDIMTIWDANPISLVSGNVADDAMSRATQIGSGDSYSVFYTPWVVIPDPVSSGGTIAIPPSGAVAGVWSRIDVTTGPWRTPAGAPAVISNAVTTEAKFSDSDQGELNYNNVNVIRSLVGAGICIMGGRTRKLWGTDRYIGPRRTLIFVKETIRRATQFAVFQNNDSHLWSALRQTAGQILTPLWEQGGLKGNSPSEAFFIRCDATINTPQVVQSGEVRMEIGVALQYPAEFIVIRISQFDSGSSITVEGLAA